MDITTINFILTIVILTIILIICLLIISAEFSAYKKRINDGRYLRQLQKDVKVTKAEIQDPRTPVRYVGSKQGIQYFRAEQSDGRDYILTNVFSKKVEKQKRRKIVRRVLDIIFSGLLLGILAWAIVVRFNDNLVSFGGKSYLTIETGSMATKHEKNTYLENDSLKQLPVFDLIEVEKVQESTKLSVFDVACYKDKETKQLIVHRIIKIDEKNGTTWYTFRGDANETSDFYLVKREEVLYKYTGHDNQGFGRFISYLKSPLGIVTIAYVVIVLLYWDITETKKEKYFNNYVDKYIDYLNRQQMLSIGRVRYL